MAAPRKPLAAKLMRVHVEGKWFGDSHILGAIKFDVARAERVALTGPSGIGKSTLLRMIAGLDAAFDGDVSGAGRLAFVFQEPTLMPWRSARDNIVLASNVTPDQADSLLAIVGLKEKAELYPTQLSLGQRRRVAIVRAFARKPDTLLMDEPFASLDLAAADSMRGLLSALLEEQPMRLILVTHDPNEAAKLADRIIKLDGSPAVIA